MSAISATNNPRRTRIAGRRGGAPPDVAGPTLIWFGADSLVWVSFGRDFEFRAFPGGLRAADAGVQDNECDEGEHRQGNARDQTALRKLESFRIHRLLVLRQDSCTSPLSNLQGGLYSYSMRREPASFAIPA
jgi:hypothetical protein